MVVAAVVAIAVARVVGAAVLLEMVAERRWQQLQEPGSERGAQAGCSGFESVWARLFVVAQVVLVAAAQK